MYINNNILNIHLKKKYIIVTFNKKVFLKQSYLKAKSKDYNFFMIVLILSRYGLFNK